MTLSDVLPRLRHVRRNARGYSALCPAHDDQTSSLSLTEENGQLLLNCFAGCAFDAILKAIGPVNGHAPSLPYRAPRAAPVLVATYDYPDLHGVLQYQVCRYEPKTFRQRRPDGKGGWTWNLANVTPMLYRWPEIVDRTSIYWVEGEKDADRLWSIGLPATTTAGGANAWGRGREAYLEQLQTAGVQDVVMLPDNDPAGQAYMHTIAEALRTHQIRARIVALPGLGPKGDVSNWLDTGHDAEALVEACRPKLRVLRSAAEFMAAPPPEPVWLVDQLLLERANGWLAAGAKIGKSYLALDLLLACALGQPWLGSLAIPRRLTVVLVEEEDSAWRVYDRWRRLAKGRDLATLPSNLYLEVRQGVRLDKPDMRERLVEDLHLIRPDLVVWDVFNRLHSQDERKPDQIMPMLFWLDQVRDLLGCANLVAHHQRKPGVLGADRASGGQKLRGPSEFWGWAENSLYLTATEKAIIVEPESKDAQLDPFKVHLEGEGDTRRWIYDGPLAAKADKGNEHRATLLSVLDATGKSLAAICAATKLSVRTASPHLTALEADGAIVSARIPGHGRTKFYALAPTQDPHET